MWEIKVAGGGYRIGVSGWKRIIVSYRNRVVVLTHAGSQDALPPF